jgi:hypothetical protein
MTVQHDQQNKKVLFFIREKRSEERGFLSGPVEGERGKK